MAAPALQKSAKKQDPAEKQESHVDRLLNAADEAKKEKGDNLPTMTREEASKFFFKK